MTDEKQDPEKKPPPVEKPPPETTPAHRHTLRRKARSLKVRFQD